MEHQMSEGEESRKVRKTGSPKEVKAERVKAKGDVKQEVSSPKSEVAMSNAEVKINAAEHSALDTPQSALTQQPTENSKLPTEEMEVHHHPDLHHQPKPWKEYLLEYFMIFLAVMTGFFAESYREHISERSKEHEYAVNIRKDLLNEKRNLDIWLPAIYTRIGRFDTLISYLETIGPVKEGSNMYYLARISTRNGIFTPSDNTIAEMKSSGNLRLIQNRDIVNGLMNIERSLEQYRNLLDIEGKEDVLSYPLLGELFDAPTFDGMLDISKNKALTEQEYANSSISLLKRPPGNPQLISHDKTKLNLLIYYLHQRKSSFLGEARQLMGMRALDEKLISAIDKEYNLDNE
jgi:hypothetical protein